MYRPLVAALIAIGSVCVHPAVSSAQDAQSGTILLSSPEPASLDVRMTASAGTDWQPNMFVRPPARGAMLPSMYVSLVGLQVYDGVSTSYGLRNGATESNPVMASLARHPGALWAAKGGAAFVSIYMAERLWRQNRRGQAIAVMLLSNGVMAAVAASNHAIVSHQR